MRLKNAIAFGAIFIAQLVEHLTVNQAVVGSSPTRKRKRGAGHLSANQALRSFGLKANGRQLQTGLVLLVEGPAVTGKEGRRRAQLRLQTVSRLTACYRLAQSFGSA